MQWGVQSTGDAIPFHDDEPAHWQRVHHAEQVGSGLIKIWRGWSTFLWICRFRIWNLDISRPETIQAMQWKVMILKRKSWVFPFVQSIKSILVKFPKLCPRHDTSLRKIFFLSLFQRSEEGKKTGYDGKLWNRTLRRLTLWKRSWIEPVDSTHSVECCSSFQERSGC